MLDLQSLSLTSAFNSIVSYFRSQENNSKFRDLTTNAEGSFLIRMLANVMSTISYRIVAQSRENYLSTAALTSSNVGIAVNLGYSAFRGSNLKRLVQLTPNGNYTLPKFSVIGSYSTDYNILTLDDVELQEGVTTTIRTVVGNVKEESLITGTSEIKIFSLFTSGISEDFILFKDSDEVPTTKIMKEMVEDKYLVRTNPYSSVDIAYLNTFSSAKYKYGTGTELTVRYVELADVPVAPYTSTMFTYGELGDVVTISPYIPFESVDSLKITAPLDHEVQNLIRSKSDYAYRLQEIIPSVSQVNFKALTPTYISKLHCLLFRGTVADLDGIMFVGEYRKTPDKYGVAAPSIAPELGVLLGEYEMKPKKTLQDILDFHVRFEKIHPFKDGNGRVGRLLMVKECLQNQIEPFVIDDKRRGEYNRGIDAWETDPLILTTVVEQAQARFRNYKDTCQLMEYCRPSTGRGAR